MKEHKLTPDIILLELCRNNHYEYYIETEYNANLYHVFGLLEPLTDQEIKKLFLDGYFDPIIEDIPA